MTIITDGLLIATCLTAALYCIVLSRRLAKFSDTKSGIGQQITQLNSILEETRTTIRESHSGAKSVSERLSRDLAGSKKASQDLAALIEKAETALDRAMELQSNQRPQRYHGDPQVRDPGPAPSVQSHGFVEPEDEKPVKDATPVEEMSMDEVAERDFDLSDARGEPQLGFLPSVSDSSGMSGLSMDDDPDESLANTKASAGDAEDPENLLKVERMAL